ncbi:MAG: hypothetical protein HY512_03660 [Candidatus Aenigmarchaeota archaeon]|nr:hypothetical protein [Candidatus Aenigmarchaeota archaeon]
MLKITEILTTTLEDVFGPKEEQYFRDVGIPCKPNAEVWIEVRRRFGDPTILYVGDKLNDVKFIANGNGVHGIIVPTSEERRQEIGEFIAKNDLEARIAIAERTSLREALPRKIQELDDGKGIYLGVDLDDTIMPDLYPAQTIAVRRLFNTLKRTPDLGSWLDRYTGLFIEQYEFRISGVQGSDRQLALAIMYLLDGNSRIDIQEGTISELKKRFEGEKGKELVGSINNALGMDLFEYDPQADIISRPFRVREAREAKDLVRKGELYLFRPVYDALMEAREREGLTIRIITNKTRAVMDAIYSVPIQVK